MVEGLGGKWKGESYACGLQHFPQTREVGDAGVEDGDGGIEEVEGGLQGGDAALEGGCHCSFFPQRSSRRETVSES